MTKHLRFLFIMLLAMIWSAGWAAVGDTYTMVTNISQLSVGDVVVIGNAANKKVMGDQSGTKFRIALDGTYSNNVFTDTKGKFAEVTLEAADNGWYLKTNTGYLYANSSSSNTINTSASSTAQGKNAIANITISNNGDATITFTGSNTHNSIRYNDNKNQMRFSCYESTNTMPLVQIYKKGSVVSKEDPKIAFAAESYEAKITDKDNTYHSYVTLNNPNNLSVTYASSKTDVAEVNAAGEVMVLGLGTTTISATFAGDDTYAKASAEYTLNVVDPNKTDVTFDFTEPEKYGYEKPTTTTPNITLSDGDKLVSSRVTITNVKGGSSTTTRFSNKKASFVTLRAYAGAILTVEAPAGFAINRIDFTDNGSQTVDNFTFSTGELKLKTWTGLAKNLTMTVDNNQVFLKNMTVNLVKLVELDEISESNTIEAKSGVNVTLKRTMVANEWNTICLPFDVTAEQATVAFGEGVKIAQLDDTSTGNILNFVDKSNYGMEAAVPYLIKPTVAATTEEYSFKGVEIKEAAVTPTKVKTNGNLYFNGIYNMVDIAKNVTEVLDDTYYAAFLGAGNKIYKTDGSGNKTKGFRAYFAIPNGAAASALRVVIDGTATSIKNIDSEVVESNAPVYNLQGQRVNGNNLTPGIYVKAGKKFVVK